MIQPHELMLNNLVMYKGQQITITELREVVCEVKSRDVPFTLLRYKYLDPIPLTPAILERCGFKEYDQSMYCHGITIGDNLLRIDLLQKTALLIHDLGFYPITNFPESLHHLQNLITALGGKIEMKP